MMIDRRLNPLSAVVTSAQYRGALALSYPASVYYKSRTKCTSIPQFSHTQSRSPRGYISPSTLFQLSSSATFFIISYAFCCDHPGVRFLCGSYVVGRAHCVSILSLGVLPCRSILIVIHSLSRPSKPIDLSGVKTPPEHIDFSSDNSGLLSSSGSTIDITKLLSPTHGVIPP
jgi:hypothetical protein